MLGMTGSSPVPVPYDGKLIAEIILKLERPVGIEPTSSAWKAEEQPISHDRKIYFVPISF
jgi:hypothetical protein